MRSVAGGEAPIEGPPGRCVPEPGGVIDVHGQEVAGGENATCPSLRMPSGEVRAETGRAVATSHTVTRLSASRLVGVASWSVAARKRPSRLLAFLNQAFDDTT